MFDYDDDELDREDEDEEIEDDDEELKELDIDENGHVCEGRKKRRVSRDDEYENDNADFEIAMPDAYGYDYDKD